MDTISRKKEELFREVELHLNQSISSIDFEWVHPLFVDNVGEVEENSHRLALLILNFYVKSYERLAKKVTHYSHYWDE